MSIIKRMRRQKAVWWQRLTLDRFGQFAFAGPVEIDCRWDGEGSEYRNAQGQTELSGATVYPDRILGLGDKLKLGELDSTTPDSPDGLTDAFEVKRMEETPNIHATETLYTAYL